MNAKNFQVGKANEPLPSDPWFSTIEAAIEHAHQLHSGSKVTHPFGYDAVGVWDDRSDWVYLFFDGERFKKV